MEAFMAEEKMVRGYQRKIIFLKNTGSEMFDEAYFVLSEKCEKEAPICDTMISEANKIIEENSQGRVKKRPSFGQIMLRYVLPFASGGSTIGIIWLICSLI